MRSAALTMYGASRRAPMTYFEIQPLLRRGQGIASKLRRMHARENTYPRAAHRTLSDVFPYLTALDPITHSAAGTKGNVLQHTFAVVEALEHVLAHNIVAFNQHKEGETINRYILTAYLKELRPYLGPKLNEELFLTALWHDNGNLISKANHALLGFLLLEPNARRETIIPPQLLEESFWLIKNHDWFGPIFFGERLPAPLYDSITNFPSASQKKLMLLLALFTLCDVRGTRNGIYLTNSKAEFYLALAKGEIPISSPNEVINYRMLRFAGNPDGTPNPQKEAAAKRIIKQLDASRKGLLEDQFGTLPFIDYGFPNFSALTAKNIVNLALLLALTMENEERKGNKIQKVYFKWGWPSEAMKAKLNTTLDHTNSLENGFKIKITPGEIIFEDII